MTLFLLCAVARMVHTTPRHWGQPCQKHGLYNRGFVVIALTLMLAASQR